MNSVYQIAQQILDDWPYAGGIKSAHKTLLVAMIAEKLSEQRQEGFESGWRGAGGIIVPDRKAAFLLAKEKP